MCGRCLHYTPVLCLSQLCFSQLPQYVHPIHSHLLIYSLSTYLKYTTSKHGSRYEHIYLQHFSTKNQAYIWNRNISQFKQGWLCAHVIKFYGTFSTFIIQSKDNSREHIFISTYKVKFIQQMSLISHLFYKWIKLSKTRVLMQFTGKCCFWNWLVHFEIINWSITCLQRENRPIHVQIWIGCIVSISIDTVQRIAKMSCLCVNPIWI